MRAPVVLWKPHTSDVRLPAAPADTRRSLAVDARSAGAAPSAVPTRDRPALPCGPDRRARRPARGGLSRLTAVVEARGVAAVALVLEPEGRVVDLHVLGDELLARLLVARDDARDGRGIVDRAADADGRGTRRQIGRAHV